MSYFLISSFADKIKVPNCRLVINTIIDKTVTSSLKYCENFINEFIVKFKRSMEFFRLKKTDAIWVFCEDEKFMAAVDISWFDIMCKDFPLHNIYSVIRTLAWKPYFEMLHSSVFAKSLMVHPVFKAA